MNLSFHEAVCWEPLSHNATYSQSDAPSHMTHDPLSPMIVLWILGFQLRIAFGERLQYRLKVPVSWCGYEDLGY